MSTTAAIIVALAALAITFVVSERLAEGRLLPSRKVRERRSDDAASKDR